MAKFLLRQERRRWLTAYAPLVFWTVFTLGLGTGLGSMSETSRILQPLLEFLFPSADSETIRFYQIVIRKLAHVFQYGVLGILAFRAVTESKKPFLFAFFFTAAVAAIDEFNQSLNPARTSNAWDVALDIVGGIMGIFLYWAILSRRYPQRGQARLPD